jgi:hypothetical protein
LNREYRAIPKTFELLSCLWLSYQILKEAFRVLPKILDWARNQWRETLSTWLSVLIILGLIEEKGNGGYVSESQLREVILSEMGQNTIEKQKRFLRELMQQRELRRTQGLGTRV